MTWIIVSIYCLISYIFLFYRIRHYPVKLGNDIDTFSSGLIFCFAPISFPFCIIELIGCLITYKGKSTYE